MVIVSNPSDVYEAGDQELFRKAVNRLHVLIFSTVEENYPVCVRVNDEQVSRGNPSVPQGSIDRYGGMLLCSLAGLIGLASLLM